MRIALLGIGHAAVFVHEHERVTVTIEPERGRALIAGDALLREGLEDLLERRLSDAVLFNAEVLLFPLKLAEEPADSLFLSVDVLLRDSQLEVLSALLEDLDLREDVRAREERHDAEAVV